MADYLSIYTGAQVDEAVRIALNFANTLSQYIPYTEINSTIPGLTNGLIASEYLPVATSNSIGAIIVGNGLLCDNAGKLVIDDTVYYNKTTLDGLLKDKADQLTVNGILETLEDISSYDISITSASEQDPSSAQTYYQLSIN